MSEKVAWKGSDALRAMLRPIADLIEDPRNVRTHDERNIEAIRKSLDGFAQTKNVVVHRFHDDKRFTVIAGNGTLRAARALGWTHIACNAFEGDDDQARAYAIADNRTSELARWDDEMLASTLADLRDAEMLDYTGFNDDELSAMIGEFSADEIGAPELASGDRSHIQQITFTLHKDQAEQVNEAIEHAKTRGAGESDLNENSNGNALAFIVAEYLRANV